MSQEVVTTYRPKTTTKSVIISRSTGPRVRNSMGGSLGFSNRASGGLSVRPEVLSRMSATGIDSYKGTREKEKRDMQDCNERLASYIEKVRWLEAQNKKLEAENEALRNRKQEDWKPIKDMYEGELNQARQVIAELSSQKGVEQAKMAGLQDEIQSLKELIGQYDANAKDYANKIDKLNNQIGEYEGELTTLRLRCGSLEDEVAKLRALNQKYKDDNARLRADLDAETTAHIEQEVLAQTKTEECEFLQDLLDKLKMVEQEPITIKGMDMEKFFKSEIKQCMKDLTDMYEEQYLEYQNECDAKYASQINQLKSGNMRDTMESEHAKTEIKRLRDQLQERNARIAELESALASIKAERDNYRMQNNELQQDLENLRKSSEEKIAGLQMTIEELIQQLNQLVDAKMSLELEIACYKKLLEGEESRTGLRTLVEHTIGSQGRGAQQLSDIIGQSTLNSSTTNRTTVQRSSKGPIGFQGAENSGASITIENSGTRSKAQNLKGWKVSKYTLDRSKTLVKIDLPDKILSSTDYLTIWAAGAKNKADCNPAVECVHEACFSFGQGSALWVLTDAEGQEKATLKMVQQG